MLLQQLVVVLLSTDDIYTLLWQINQRFGTTIKIGVYAACVLTEKRRSTCLLKNLENDTINQLINI